MTTQELKRLYEKDVDTGCWHWQGSSKVRYGGRVWYPHLLLWVLTKQPSISKGKALVRQCASADCISPYHRAPQPKHAPIAAYQYTPPPARAPARAGL